MHADQANPFANWPVISVYSRTQALADGILLDATELARSVGFTIPLAVTYSIRGDYPNDEDLAKLLTAFYHQIAFGGGTKDSQLVLHNQRGSDAFLEIGPGDDESLVLTLMRSDDL